MSEDNYARLVARLSKSRSRCRPGFDLELDILLEFAARSLDALARALMRIPLLRQ